MRRQLLWMAASCMLGILLGMLFNQPIRHPEPKKTVSRSSQSRYEEVPSGILKDRILYQGDTTAYQKLMTRILLKSGDKPATLPWALIMANKYKYNKAYFDVFEAIAYTEPDGTGRELRHLDSATKTFALEYLKLAFTAGDIRASALYTHMMSE